MSKTKPENMVLEIKPPKGFVKVDFKELWQHRELLYILVWRNIKARYKQTIIGASWAILSPFFSMVIYTIIFGVLAKIPSDNIPYAVFVYTGLLYWTYFSTALVGASNSLVESQHIIKKIYVPRLIFPLTNTATPLVDFLLSLLILFVLMFYFHYLPSFLGILLIPILILIAFLAATGLGLFMASINVKYRDIPFVLSFFIQVLFYVTPIIYPVSMIPARFQWLVFLNPMAGVTTIARSSLLHTVPINWLILAVSFGESMLLFFLGIAYFRKAERYFADIL